MSVAMVKPPDNKTLQSDPAHRVAPPSANMTNMRGMTPAKRPGFAEGTADVPRIANTTPAYGSTPSALLPNSGIRLGPLTIGNPSPASVDTPFNRDYDAFAAAQSAKNVPTASVPAAIAANYRANRDVPIASVPNAVLNYFNRPVAAQVPDMRASTLLNPNSPAPVGTPETPAHPAFLATLGAHVLESMKNRAPPAVASLNSDAGAVAPHYSTAEHAIANPEMHTPESFSAATHGLNMRQAMTLAQLNLARAQVYTQTHQNSILDQLIASEAARGHGAEAHNLALHAAGVYGPQGVLLNTNQNTYSQGVDEYGNPIEQ